MNITLIAAFLLMLGTIMSAAGFGSFPPVIYTGRNVQEKLDILAAQPCRWIFSQVLVILGSLIAMGGSVFLVILFRDSRAFIPAGISAVLFILGHIFWIWIVGMRIVEPVRQAKDDFPAWLFPMFSILILSGLAGFGASFWLQGVYLVLGVAIFLAALLILGMFLKFKGMPPIVYFTISLIMGLALLF